MKNLLILMTDIQGYLVAISVFLLVIVYVVWYVISETKQKEKNKKELEEQIRVRKEEKKNSLIKKYGEEKGMKLFNEQYFLGMTKEELLDSKEYEPDKIETEVLKTKTKETWIYGNKSSGDVFVFENDILTKIKDR